MGRDNFYNSRGRGGRGGGGGGGPRGGRGGRDNRDGAGRDNRGRGGRGRGGGGRYRRGGHDPRQASEGGNRRERIAVESGHLVLIDQFMLANPEFIESLARIVDADPVEKDKLVQEFGGCVVELSPDTYRIDRDPFKLSIVVHRQDETPQQKELSASATESAGHVFVDTRCLAMIDRELLDDASLLEKYQQLWFSGQDKACRDLLRDNGGAVRYGFERDGDELGIYRVPGQDVLALWPDVVEPAPIEEATA